ncbi:PREDICTED: uncharacterized protein LOC109484040 [Branchiostoma belcheri]|uniref:Uncharacterized protein LOC109484040 n=1 Tax=Branchiostoma belcheri TaxID=7741 RepID=A0A6P5A987_BRABE|nr:PREDICTED: uncharacterized protein LOC109484040 [Branchiostoma belcheri]
MEREKDGGESESVPVTTKKYRTRSGNSTKPWNTPAKNIREFEVLSEDYADSDRTKVCNLKCRTSSDRIPLWINATKAYLDEELEKQTGYKFTWKDKNCQLIITDPTKSGESIKVVNIHFYKSGTILVHGKGSKWYAENIFPKVKVTVNNPASSSQNQDGGQTADQLTLNEVETKDNNPETIEDLSDHGKSAMMASDTELDQTTPTKPGATDLTSEKENRTEYTTPKSVTSPSIRKVFGGLENIILSPFTKMRESTGKSREEKSRQTNRSRRDILADNSLPEKSADSNSETLYTTLVDELNELKTLVFNNKVAMDKQGQQVADLQANVQNKTKKIEKQAKQIENLMTELQHQREFSKDLSDKLSSKCACVCATRGDEWRIQRLYSEIVSSAAQNDTYAPDTQTSATPDKQGGAVSDMKTPEAPRNKQTPAASRSQAPVPTGTDTRIQVVSGTQEPASPAIQAPTDPGKQPLAPTDPGKQPPAASSPDSRAQAVPCTQSPTTHDTRSPTNPGAQATTTPGTQASVTYPAQKEKKQIRIFADSLWNGVDTNRMFKNKSSSIVKSSTVRKASENVNSSPDNTTELVILHVGSNDMDNTRARSDSVNICIEETRKLINNAKTSFPNATIAMSQVLPRGLHMDSTLNKNIAMYNDNVEKLCLEDDRLFYIRHRLLSQERSLYKPDRIHITPDAGVSLLVADVKRTLRHHQQSVADRSRQHSGHSGQQTRPPRKTSRENTVTYMQSGRYAPPSRFSQAQRNPAPLLPWNQSPPAPQRRSNWNERQGSRWSEA